MKLVTSFYRIRRRKSNKDKKVNKETLGTATSFFHVRIQLEVCHLTKIGEKAAIADCQNYLPYCATGFATECERAIKAPVELDEQLFLSQTHQLGS